MPQFPNEQLPVTIRSVQNAKCLDIRAAGGDGAELQQYTCGEQENQTWWLVWTGGSDYQLRPGHLGNVRLGIANGSTGDGAPAHLINGDFSSQIFQFALQSDGSHTIINKRSGKCLDIPYASSLDGVTIQQYACHNGTNQRWRIVPRARPMHIVSKTSGRCMDVAGVSQADGAPIQQYDCLGTQQDNQEWIAEPLGSSGYHRLRAAHSNKCLSTAGPYQYDIAQTTCNSKAPAQQWRITSDADGSVEIRNRNYVCLDVLSGLGNGTPVRGYSCYGWPSQRFSIRRMIQRHVLVVQPATTMGFDRYTANPADIALAVAQVNAVYRQHGIELLFDPATDVLDLESDALHTIGDLSRSTELMPCEGFADLDTPSNCGDRVGRDHPEHVVLMIGPGAVAGFSSGMSGFVFLRPGTIPNHCGTTATSTILPHELGHYFGLAHVMVGFPNGFAAGSAYQASGDAAFDGDLLEDTAPDPLLNGGCLSPTSPYGYQLLLIPPAPPLFISQIWYGVRTDQVMSYYFNVNPMITQQQAAIVRATAYARRL